MAESFTNKIVRAAGIVSTTDAGAAIGAGASAITSIQTADLNVGDLVVNQNFRSGAKIQSITKSTSLLVDRSSVNTAAATGGSYGGSKGAFNLANNTSISDQFMGAGFVTSIAGIGIYTSTSVPDGSDATMKKGGLFSRTALGVGYIDFGGGNFIQMASEREEVSAKTTLVANAYYVKSILVNAHGVEVHTEIS